MGDVSIMGMLLCRAYCNRSCAMQAGSEGPILLTTLQRPRRGKRWARLAHLSPHDPPFLTHPKRAN